MTDYHTLGESIHREWRPIGEPRWIELSLDERIYWQSVAVAAERVIALPEPDEEWCPDCSDNRYKIEELEDEVFDLNEIIKKLRAKS